ncbi:MAG: hypothetical protein JWP95_1439 [Actinotalea sp.]|nr:hypothetical protein [Actinotalea sp.]
MKVLHADVQQRTGASGVTWVGLGALVGGSVVLGLLTARWPAATPALGLLAVLLLVGWAVPRSWLPSVALVLLLTVPMEDLPLPSALQTLSPPSLVVLLWALRFVVEESGRVSRSVEQARLAVVLVPMVGLLALSWLLTTERAVAAGWGIAFCVNVLVVVVLLVHETERARATVLDTWRVLAAVLGLLALLEAFVLRDNLVLELVHAVVGGPLAFEQEWGVYRATTTIGHPLENAAFFALSIPLALVPALRRPSVLRVLGVLLPVGGLAATVSRGASVATLVAVGALLAVEAHRDPAQRRRVAVGCGVLTVVVVLGAALQLQRTATAEAASSTDYRVGVVGQGLAEVAARPLLGVGPGVSSVHKEASTGGSTAALSYENGWLESAVSVGLPFTVLLLGLVLWAASRAARRGDVDLATALVLLVLIMSTYNILEGDRPGLLRIGLLVGLGIAGASRERCSPCAA